MPTLVPLAEEVLGAIDRDASALAESLSTVVANLRSTLATCGGDTMEHVGVHLEASATMHDATRTAVKEASGLVSEVIRVSEEARKLTGLAAGGGVLRLPIPIPFTHCCVIPSRTLFSSRFYYSQTVLLRWW